MMSLSQDYEFFALALRFPGSWHDLGARPWWQYSNNHHGRLSNIVAVKVEE